MAHALALAGALPQLGPTAAGKATVDRSLEESGHLQADGSGSDSSCEFWQLRCRVREGLKQNANAFFDRRSASPPHGSPSRVNFSALDWKSLAPSKIASTGACRAGR